MDKDYKEAYAEVLEIIKHSDQDIISKVPQKLINFLEENKDDEYIAKIDFNQENWEDFLKKETMAIIALIYRDFILSETERMKLIEEEKKEQQKKEEFYSNNLFKKEAKSENEISTIENMQLVKIRESNWFKRFLKKVRDIFGIGKQH